MCAFVTLNAVVLLQSFESSFRTFTSTFGSSDDGRLLIYLPHSRKSSNRFVQRITFVFFQRGTWGPLLLSCLAVAGFLSELCLSRDFVELDVDGSAGKGR